MAIPDNIVDEIQEKSDIVETISRYIPLKKMGRSYKALCPFHNEKTPSFVVSPDKQIYHCFGCGAGGNVFSFLMRYENIEFPEAAQILAQKAGVAIPRSAGQRQEVSSLATQLYRINELALQFYQACLAKSPQAKDYVASRGIGEETAKTFKIGYSPDAWEALLNHLKQKGISEALLEKAGLVISNEKGGYYDRFRHRVLFPIMDVKERVLGFGARVLDSSLPKYINSPETPIYYKGKNLYGFNLSREHIKKAGHVLVVEGYLDFIIPYQAGIRNIVATLGTALTIDQVKMLKRFTTTAVMVYDPDEAGEMASLRNLDLFISEDVNVYIAELPKGYDPDGFIRKFGADDFRKVIKSSKNLFDYKFGKLASKYDVRTSHGKARIAAEILPTISRIENAVLRSNLVKKLAEKLSVDEESIRTELKKVKPDYSERKYFMGAIETSRCDVKIAEKMLLSLLLEGRDYIDKAMEKISLDEFKDSSIRDVAKVIFDLRKENKEVNPARLISHLGETGMAASLIPEVVELSEVVTDKEKAFSDCIARIKKDNIKDQLERLQLAIKTAHDSRDDDSVKRLVTEYNALLKNSSNTPL